MRNLQYFFFFLGLFGLSLTAACTVTTSDSKGGNGGEATEGGASNTGGKASGGNSSGGASAVGGTTATTTPFTAADCTTAATVLPTSAPDVTAACITCLYTKACPEAVACQNDSACMSQIVPALECVQLYYYYAESTVLPEQVAACQTGELTAPPTGADSIAIVSTDPKAWLGAMLGEAANDLMAKLVEQCSTDCSVAP
jgi:hypothetical protein